MTSQVAPAIHPTAVVEPGASIDPTARVGPYAVIGSGVVLGPDTRVEAHAVIQGQTVLGRGNRVGAHAALGGLPQIRDLADPAGRLVIGDRNWFRELVTVHVGSPGSTTRIGDGNLLMAYSHVAHDCRIDDEVELANGVQLAGHVQVGDHATLGGLAAVHQFVRVGAHAFIAAGSMVSQDVPPFTLVSGNRARLYGLNSVGLRRHGFDLRVRRDLGRALRLLMRAPTLRDGLQRIRQQVDSSEAVLELVAFAEMSERGLCRSKGA